MCKGKEESEGGIDGRDEKEEEEEEEEVRGEVYEA